MGGYQPLKIIGNKSGLIQEREEFLLPDDAYPTLNNAYVWRERILRKKGYQLLGRLQRSEAVATNLAGGSVNLIVALGLEATASIVPGSISITGGTDGTVYTDPLKNGTLTATGGTGTGGTINYSTGVLTITAGGNEAITGTIQYYPGLPVMGIKTEELTNSANDRTIFFDQTYAYIYNSGSGIFQEFIPGTTWNKKGEAVSSTSFFWSTNYWVSDGVIFGTTNFKLFWVTNNTGQFGVNADPPRITDGTTWVDFYHDVNPALSAWAQIDATPTYLTNWLAMLPFRGRMVVFNTWEGANATGSLNYRQRIRWSTIGNPFIAYTAGPPAAGSWRDDIRGQGGFLDIPTAEDIISVGFVRDNLVIFCERSTWQLRYTGRSIAPFQIEKVNSENGAEGPFSLIQFDTSILAIGDKGIIECDSYKAERIDIKIPDLVFSFESTNNGVFRVQGARNFITRLAFWTFPSAAANPDGTGNVIFPNQRLVYNYENDSWAIFNDSLTALGNYQPTGGQRWIDIHKPWIECNFSWIGSAPSEIPLIVGGNQQGFIEILDKYTVNDPSLYISAITANTTTPTVITSPNHNMQTGFIIGISGIPTATAFANLNGGIFGINVTGVNTFQLFTYNATEDVFNTPQLDVPTTAYVGGGLINIRENFSIISKKFNFLDEGQNIQMGYIDILMSATGNDNPGAISLNVYLNYDDVNPSNILPNNVIDNGNEPDEPDTFFNTTIPTTPSIYAVAPEGSKFWQRVYCATRANFLTLEYNFSNLQMSGLEQEQDVQIDGQVLWLRKAGRMSQF